MNCVVHLEFDTRSFAGPEAAITFVETKLKIQRCN